MFTRGTGSDHHASGAYEVGAQTEQVSDVTCTSSDHGVKRPRSLSYNVLQARGHQPGCGELELPDDGRQERRSALPRLNHRQREIRINQLEGDSGNPGTGTCVEHHPRVRGDHTAEE